jgi:hypothetical protein
MHGRIVNGGTQQIPLFVRQLTRRGILFVPEVPTPRGSRRYAGRGRA